MAYFCGASAGTPNTLCADGSVPGMASPFVEIEVGERTVKVTNPEKLYFPDVGVRKIDYVNYHLAVGDGILRALRDRPVTMERWPGGVVPGVKQATRADPHVLRPFAVVKRGRVTYPFFEAPFFESEAS